MLKKNHILIIDDNENQLALYQTWLEKAGYTVSKAFNGMQGLSLAKREKPELLVIDYNMPGLTGIDFCREIRRDPDLKDAILVINTCKNCTEEEIDAFNDYADGWISKLEGLEQVMNKVVSWSKLLRSMD